MNKQHLTQTALAVVITAVVAFAAGAGVMKVKQKASLATFTRGNGNAMMLRDGAPRQGGIGMGGNRTAFRPVTGDVIAVDATSMTVKLPDGSTKIVLLGEGTTVSKTDTGATSDIKVGSKVGVFGTENKDGSVSAQNVQLNPQFKAMQGTTTPPATPVNK